MDNRTDMYAARNGGLKEQVLGMRKIINNLTEKNENLKAINTKLDKSFTKAHNENVSYARDVDDLRNQRDYLLTELKQLKAKG